LHFRVDIYTSFVQASEVADEYLSNTDAYNCVLLLFLNLGFWPAKENELHGIFGACINKNWSKIYRVSSRDGIMGVRGRGLFLSFFIHTHFLLLLFISE